MKITKVFSYCILLSSLGVGMSRQADAAIYTIHFSGSRITPASLDVQVGDVINWDESFTWHTVTMTDPKGSTFRIFDQPDKKEIVYSFTVRFPGSYTYVDSVMGTCGYSPYFLYIGRFRAKPMAPVLSSDTSALDFGTLEVGLTKRLSFRLTNIKVGPVMIDAVTHGESCFSIEDPALPLTIGPGETKVVSVLCNPAMTGRIADTLSVESSDIPILTIPIQAEATEATVNSLRDAVSSVRDIEQRSVLSMTINYDKLSGAAKVTFLARRPYELRLVLYDNLGRQVFADEHVVLNTGETTVPLSTGTLPSGEYYLQAITGGAIAATGRVMMAH
jgi:hypothetical protein